MIFHRMPRALIVLAFFALVLGCRSVQAQKDHLTIKDYYLLMPQKYDSSSEEERQEILDYVSDTTIDIANGYISYVTPLSGEVFEITLFRRPDGVPMIAYNEDCDLKNGVFTKLYFLSYDAGTWTDVTSDVMPVAVEKRYKYKLPQKGTTILVTDAKGKAMYSLVWKDGKFTKR